MMFGKSEKPQAEIKKPSRRAIAVRSFAAANISRLLDGWRVDYGFTPAEIAGSLELVRGRSRDMEKNSEHYKRAIDLNVINIIGPEGFALKSTPHDNKQNGEMMLDEKAARFIEYHWWKFCNWRDPKTRQTYVDATGRKTAAQMDRLNCQTWKRDGEYFIHVLRTSRNPYGITFRVLRPDWCDHTYNKSKTGRGTLIHNGVEIDEETRRPVAYWFHSAPESAYAVNQRGQPLTRIPASEIIHGYTQRDEDQPRGFPDGHAVLQKLKMLDEYNKAELIAAQDEACTVRTYEAEEGADPEGFVDLTDAENSDAAQALVQDKSPGQSEIIPRGYKMRVHTPQHPNRELTNFKNSMLRDVATGLNLEYSNYTNDWAGVSFSSVRSGTISERDHWITEQNQFICQCKTPMFLAWLESFLSLSISGNLPTSKFEKFAEHEFRGRRWMWVDPIKDMNAAVVAVNNGWRTNAQVASDLGGDYFDNMEDYKRENKAREDAGFVKVLKPGESVVTTDGGEKDEE
jgi:lambda family phage portal protein